MKTIREILKLSTDYLEGKKIAEPRRQAEELLADFLGLKRLELYLDFDRPMEMREIDLFRERLRKRGKGEPIPYIQGEIEFYNCTIKLTPDVLIPRQETELLTDQIVNDLKGIPLRGLRLWDICCGSGCLGIALKNALPELEVTLSDISEKALAVAKENAERNEVRVKCLQGDLFDPFKGEKTNFIVCNPPYVSEREWESLDREVKDFEPKQALVPGPTGLEFYIRFADELRDYLLPRGRVWLEIGYNQGPHILKIFNLNGWTRCSVLKDWAGHDRFFFLENE
jgi:release factor glutamine methyltransferase